MKSEGVVSSTYDWPALSLHDAGISLIDCEHRTPPASKDGYPYVAIPQIKEGHLDLIDVRRITREHFLEWTRKAHPEPDDVVLSRRCNPGETAFVPPGLEFALGQNLVLLRTHGEKVYKPFLRWLVRGPEWWTEVSKFINVGAIFDSLKCADIPNFTLHIPPMSEQKSIAHILGTLDSKIEVNQRMNKTLETIGKAIFKHWFIAFEFPNKEGKPYKSSGGEMVYSEEVEKEVPKIWKIGNATELFTLEYGWHLPEWDRKEGIVPVYGSGGLTGYHNSFLVEGPGIIIGRAGKVGPESIYYSHSNFCPIETTFYVLAKDKQIVRYLYLFLQTLETVNTGSSVPNLSRRDIHNARIVIPNNDVIEAFDNIVESIFANIANSETEIDCLSKIRDLLLPKLMTGKIRVPVEAR